MLLRRVLFAKSNSSVSASRFQGLAPVHIIHADRRVPHHGRARGGIGNGRAVGSVPGGFEAQGGEGLLVLGLVKELLHHQLGVSLESLVNVLEEEVVV